MVALTTTSIAWLLFAVILGGWAIYAFLNIRAARDELGSERELAANRKPYYDDETLEGERLTRVLGIGLILMVVIVVALPLYWILEPGRQAGAQAEKERQFEEWGAGLFAPTAEGGFNCAGCHGGMNATGGVAAFNVTDPATGEVTAVNWTAPALNTVFSRFDEDEVREILTYGRAGTPMPPWGVDGGGPMNDQQIDTLLAYLESIQVERENCAEGEDDPRLCESGNLPAEEQEAIQAAAQKLVDDGVYATIGEALFNLDLNGGAYSCARCHTPGWSYGDPGTTGQGALGWNLREGAVNQHFPIESDLETFIATGTERGAAYGEQGQGTGRMPGFGVLLTDDQIHEIAEFIRGL